MSTDRVIWKFPLTATAEQAIDMPAEPRLLHAGLDLLGALCVWAEVDADLPSHPRRIHLAGTNHRLSGDFATGRHLGTVSDGPFMWHVFDGGAA